MNFTACWLHVIDEGTPLTNDVLADCYPIIGFWWLASPRFLLQVKYPCNCFSFPPHICGRVIAKIRLCHFLTKYTVTTEYKYEDNPSILLNSYSFQLLLFSNHASPSSHQHKAHHVPLMRA